MKFIDKKSEEGSGKTLPIFGIGIFNKLNIWDNTLRFLGIYGIIFN